MPKKTSVQTLTRKRLLGKLLEIDFKQAGNGLCIKQYQLDIYGTIGLNIASYAEGMFIVNPVVGVMHRTCEKIVAELSNEKFDMKTPIATLSVSLGHLMDKFKIWKFSQNSDPQNCCLEIMDAIVSFGIPFMNNHT